MRIFKSIRNEQTAELISIIEEQVTLKMQDGQEKTMSKGTLKRWWKELEEAAEAVPQDDTIIPEPPRVVTQLKLSPDSEMMEIGIDNPPEEPEIEIDSQPEEPTVKAKAVIKPKSTKSKASKKDSPDADPGLVEFIEGLATDAHTEIYAATSQNFKSLKVDGKMYMAFTFSKKGVTLWMRSKAIDGITEYKHSNHMFDARVHFDSLTGDDKELITKLMRASLQYQISKTNK